MLSLPPQSDRDGAISKVKLAIKLSIYSRYLACTIVYVVYAAVMVLAPDYFQDSDPETLNRVYMIFGVLHLLNACMYVWSWEDRAWSDPVVYPEYLNVVGAVLYLGASILYGDECNAKECFSYANSKLYYIERWLELVASVVEGFASVGWVAVWATEFNRAVLLNGGRPIPGRGWTLDDPDVWANASILVAAAIYLAYNFRVLLHPNMYNTDELYRTGDRWYMCNAIFYLLAATRDCGWFWFMPSFGLIATRSRITQADTIDGLELLHGTITNNTGRPLYQNLKSEEECEYSLDFLRNDGVDSTEEDGRRAFVQLTALTGSSSTTDGSGINGEGIPSDAVDPGHHKS